MSSLNISQHGMLVEDSQESIYKSLSYLLGFKLNFEFKYHKKKQSYSDEKIHYFDFCTIHTYLKRKGNIIFVIYDVSILYDPISNFSEYEFHAGLYKNLIYQETYILKINWCYELWNVGYTLSYERDVVYKPCILVKGYDYYIPFLNNHIYTDYFYKYDYKNGHTMTSTNISDLGKYNFFEQFLNFDMCILDVFFLAYLYGINMFDKKTEYESENLIKITKIGLLYGGYTDIQKYVLSFLSERDHHILFNHSINI
jgi:hypothetical protein